MVLILNSFKVRNLSSTVYYCLNKYFDNLVILILTTTMIKLGKIISKSLTREILFKFYL